MKLIQRIMALAFISTRFKMEAEGSHTKEKMQQQIQELAQENALLQQKLRRAEGLGKCDWLPLLEDIYSDIHAARFDRQNIVEAERKMRDLRALLFRATSTTEARLTDSLLAMIASISSALGISEEEQSVANGAEEILFAIQELKKESQKLTHEEELHSHTLDQRDRAEEAADALAKAISEHFRVDIGEHSNMNDPWREALLVMGGEYVTDSDQDRAITKLYGASKHILDILDHPTRSVSALDADRLRDAINPISPTVSTPS